MSPSVQCLSVRMPRCSFHADSDRDEPPSMLCNICKTASRDGIDPFNSDLAGMPLSLLGYPLYICSICNNVAILLFKYLSINDNHHNMVVTYYSFFT